MNPLAGNSIRNSKNCCGNSSNDGTVCGRACRHWDIWLLSQQVHGMHIGMLHTRLPLLFLCDAPAICAAPNAGAGMRLAPLTWSGPPGGTRPASRFSMASCAAAPAVCMAATQPHPLSPAKTSPSAPTSQHPLSVHSSAKAPTRHGASIPMSCQTVTLARPAHCSHHQAQLTAGATPTLSARARPPTMAGSGAPVPPTAPAQPTTPTWQTSQRLFAQPIQQSCCRSQTLCPGPHHPHTPCLICLPEQSTSTGWTFSWVWSSQGRTCQHEIRSHA